MAGSGLQRSIIGLLGGLLCLLLVGNSGLNLTITAGRTVPASKRARPVAAELRPSQTAAKSSEGTNGRVVNAYGKLPISFEANQGQSDTQVKFLARGRGYALFLTNTEVVLALSQSPGHKSQPERSPATMAAELEGDRATAATVLKMELVGANPAPRVEGFDQLTGKSNYFLGSDPKKWRTDVPHYAKVRYEGIYPGVDLVFYGKQRQLEYDFIVTPGARPDTIALDIHGADRVKTDSNGDLLVLVHDEEIRLHNPLIYQEADGNRQEIAGGFVLKGKHQVGFQVATYDANRPLVIDPVLSYSTYLGGSNTDRGNAIAVDASGNAYVTGGTFSLDFPTAGSPVQGSNGGQLNVFVTKINATGTALVYSTYLGGNGPLPGDEGYGIAVDSSGNAYVTGLTLSVNFPIVNALQSTLHGPADAFVTKINPAGSALVYSTYLGGSNGERGLGIAVDSAGNAYVLGRTTSTDFPTVNAFQATKGADGCAFPPCFDAFVTKINPAGSALLYSTYLGGKGDENFTVFGGIAVDASGNAYVTGPTESTDFPTVNPFQSALRGSSDAYITKIDPSKVGSASVVYSTYLGGSGFDGGADITVDASGNAYVTGVTGSTDFPTTTGAFQTTFGGGMSDAFVTKLNAAGSGLVYSTYLGGSNDDFVALTEVNGGIAVDGAGNAYVTGSTNSTNFPTVNPFQPSLRGFSNAFVAKFNPTGSGLVYSTYLGGSQREQGSSIAVDASGNAYVTGFTVSPDFPTTPGAFDTTCGTDGKCNLQLSGASFPDAFIAKIASGAPGPAVSLSPKSLTFSSQVVGTTSAAQTVTLNNTGNAPLTVSSIAIGGANNGDFSQTDNCPLSPATLGAGANCTINVTFTPVATGTRTGSVTITDDAAGSPQSVSLSGTGAPPTPVVSLSPTSLNFGSQPVGSASAAQTVTLSNTGSATLNVTSVAVTGANSGDFALSSGTTCTNGSTVAAGASCLIKVTFTPAAAGNRTGAATITDNAADSPQTVPLAGTGTTDFSISASPTSATIAAGQSTTYTLTITPSGGFNQSVSLSCTGAPAAATCSISPSSVTLNGPTASMATATVATTARSVVVPRPRAFPPSVSLRFGLRWLALLLAFAMLAGLLAAKRQRPWASFAMTMLLAILLAACGGGGGAAPVTQGTPAGTYTLTFTGTSGTLSHNTTVSLKVN